MILKNIMQFPAGCETRRYIASLTSLYMYCEEKQGRSFQGFCNNEQFHMGNPCVQCKSCDTYEIKARENIYQSLLTVSGIGVMCYLDNFLPYDQCKMVDLSASPLEFIAHTMKFLSYRYHILSKEAGQPVIQSQIVDSLKREVPVIMRFGEGNYTLLIGYDKEGEILYGYDGKGGYNEIVLSEDSYCPDTYLQEKIFVHSYWYKQMDFAIIVDGKSTEKMSFREIAQINIDSISKERAVGYGKKLIAFLQDEQRVMHTSDRELQNIYRYINLYFGFLAEQRRFVGNTFAIRFGGADVGKEAGRLLDIASEIYCNSHDIAFVGWRAAGEISGGSVENLKDSEQRNTMVQALKQIWENDVAVQSLLEIFKCCAKREC